jgi:hypothetical protein
LNLMMLYYSILHNYLDNLVFYVAFLLANYDINVYYLS